MAASIGQRPAGGAGLGLLHLPARRLLGPMVASAFGAEVALVGGTLGVGDCVVQVAVDGLSVAAGGIAGDRAGADEVAEFAAGGVAVLGVPVVAVALGDGLEDDLERAEQVAEPGCLGGVGAVAARRC